MAVPIGVDVFFVVVLVVFPPHLGDWVGGFGVFMCFMCILRAFFGVLVCVWNVFFP